MIIDLKSFFPSIRPERVQQALKTEQACSQSVASLLTKLTTYNFELPQGAPTSTSIANIVTFRLQRRIVGICDVWGYKEFTIYCDDIVISSASIQDEFVKRVKNIIRDEGFKIHPSKGGVINKSGAQVITGVNISHGNTVGQQKRVWRAEHHNDQKFKAGKISKEEFDASEKRYLARLSYEKNVRRAK